MSLFLSLPEVLLIHIFEFIGISGLKLLSVCSELKNYYGETIQKIAKTLFVQFALESNETSQANLNPILKNYIADHFNEYGHRDIFLTILVSSVVRDDQITLQLCLKYPQFYLDPSGSVISSGIAVDGTQIPQTSLLEIAAIFDSLQVAKLLLEQRVGGENVHSHGAGQTSRTHIAAWNTSIRILKLLLDHGGQVNARNSWDYPRISDLGITPLHATLLGPFSRGDYSIETQIKTVECMKLLVDFGARLDVYTGPISVTNPTGPGVTAFYQRRRSCRPCSLSLLHLAVLCQNKLAIQYLLEQGSTERRSGIENIPNFALYNDDCDDLYNEPFEKSNENSSVDESDNSSSVEESEREIDEADLVLPDPFPSLKPASSEGEIEQPDTGGEDMEIFFSELGDINFLEKVPFRRLYYPRTLAIATAAYLANQKDYEIYLEIALLLCDHQKSINSELGTLTPNDPSCSKKLFDHLSPYHILTCFDSTSRNETVKSQSRIPSCYSSYIHYLRHPLDDDLRIQMELPFHLLNEILKIRLNCQNELPIHIFHALLKIAIVPVRIFYDSLGDFDPILGSDFTPEKVYHALETIISGSQSFFGVLLEVILSTDIDPPIFTPHTTQSLIEGKATNTIESDFEAPSLLFSSRLLQFLLWTLINETYLSRSRLLFGHYISATLVFQNLDADPPITLGEYLWLYLGTISEDNQLMEIFFPIDEMTDLEMWELSKWTRRSDETFLEFLVDSLEKKNFESADPELLMNSLFDFDFDCSDPRYTVKMTKILDTVKVLIQTKFERDSWYDEDHGISVPTPEELFRLQKLSWKMGLKLKISGLRDTNDKICCRCGDAYQHLRLFSEGLNCYREGLSRPRTRVLQSNKTRVEDHTDAPGSDEKSFIVRCIFGMAECHAALGNVNTSFKLFRTAFQILYWHHSIVTRIQSIEEEERVNWKSDQLSSTEF